MREIDLRDELARPPKRRLPDLSGNRWRWIIIGALGVIGLFSLTQALQPDPETTDPIVLPAASSTTTAAPSAGVTISTLPPIVTTGAPVPPPTTVPATTTTSTTTSSTTTTTDEHDHSPAFRRGGRRSSTGRRPDLSLLGIGPLRFGDPGAEVLGALAATFGQPTLTPAR